MSKKTIQTILLLACLLAVALAIHPAFAATRTTSTPATEPYADGRMQLPDATIALVPGAAELQGATKPYADGRMQLPGETIALAPGAAELPRATAAQAGDALQFSDVKQSDWYYTKLARLYNMRIVQGYPDGSFRPGNALSRAEFIKLLVSALDRGSAVMPYGSQGGQALDWGSAVVPYASKGDQAGDRGSAVVPYGSQGGQAGDRGSAVAPYGSQGGQAGDRDSAVAPYGGHTTNRDSNAAPHTRWADYAIDFALRNRIITDVDTATLHLPLARQDMALMIANALRYLGEADIAKTAEYVPLIADYYSIPAHLREAVLQSYAKGVLTGFSDGYFRGGAALTRAEACTVTLRIIDPAERNPQHYPVPVFMYHHLLPEADIKKYGWAGNDSVLSVEQFAGHMAFLHENGFHTASLQELDDFLNRNVPLPKKSVVITFDDGYRSNLEYAYPIMKQYGFRGAIFLIGSTSSRQQKDFSPEGLQHISFSITGDYADVFEFGSHTYDLHAQIAGGPAMYKASYAAIEEDFRMMRLTHATAYIAYPYGAHNGSLLKVMKNEGYALGFTVEPGYVNGKTHPYKIPRFGMRQNTSLEDFKKIVLNLK